MRFPRKHRYSLEEAVDILSANVKVLRASLREMIETQDEWERAVGNIIGRRVGVFERAIDRAKKVLEETE